MIQLHPTTYGPALADLLQRAGLPNADLADAANTAAVRLYIARDADAETAAMIGLEQYASVGLLRSLAVVPAQRGRGWGRALVDAVEQLARHQGIDQLYLLTTDAAAFFSALGYQTIERSAAAAAIQSCTQFRSLCPASAVVMMKRLAA